MDDGAPTRHNILWQDPEFTDSDLIDQELRRVFDICHGCRRCFNLCDSFPTLFDLIDDSKTGEIDSVESKNFSKVVDACTLCDMCFMTKCPYVPPHEFDLDFPHLMLRARASDASAGKISFIKRELRKIDRNSKLISTISSFYNWATKESNKIIRYVIEVILQIDKRARLPVYSRKSLLKLAKNNLSEVNSSAPANSRKVVLFSSCATNYNNTSIGLSAREVLSRNGINSEVIYLGCCGMPQWELGEIPKVAERAEEISKKLCNWIDEGHDIVTLTSSCALMLKFEWPLLLPDNQNVRRVSSKTSDISEYIVSIARNEGLAEGIKPVKGSIALHLACHARAQNIGPKALEMLNLIPESKVQVLERCSGHGGAWGVEKDNFEVALKVGVPVARKAKDVGADFVASECPLAADHIVQGIEILEGEKGNQSAVHPIEIFALAYGYKSE